MGAAAQQSVEAEPAGSRSAGPDPKVPIVERGDYVTADHNSDRSSSGYRLCFSTCGVAWGSRMRSFDPMLLAAVLIVLALVAMDVYALAH